MRLGRLLLSVVSATALLVFPGATSASAEPSDQCDGVGARKVTVLESPVKLSLLLFAPETTMRNHLIVCYSTPADVTGGALVVYYGYENYGNWHGAYLNVYCQPDGGIVLGPDCTVPNGVFVNLDDAPKVTTSCVVWSGPTCVVFIPGIQLEGGQPWLAHVIVAGVPITVNIPG